MEEPIVTDAMKTRREDVQQVAANELEGLEADGAVVFTLTLFDQDSD